jgi:23S rRNA U2552 (ribose-2'-O)-methylase RlmE/FtsJ
MIPRCTVIQTSKQRLLSHLYDHYSILSMQEQKESITAYKAQALNKHSYLFEVY